jgi:molybdopterin molybdotransferase
LVFGLPGNPVSGIVSFLLFVRPALDVLAGRSVPLSSTAPPVLGRLAAPFLHQGDRPTYYPCRLQAAGASQPLIELLDWAGSADLRTVANADGFAMFAAGNRTYEAGELVGFLPLG